MVLLRCCCVKLRYKIAQEITKHRKVSKINSFVFQTFVRINKPRREVKFIWLNMLLRREVVELLCSRLIKFVAYFVF